MRQGVEAAASMAVENASNQNFDLGNYTQQRQESQKRMEAQRFTIALDECELADKRLDGANILASMDNNNGDPESFKIVMQAAVKMGTLKPEDARMLANYYRTYNNPKFA